MNKELLNKYCKNTCSEEELGSVLEWFEGSAGTSEGKVLLLKVWEELSEEEGNLHINFDLILDKIHHEVNLSEAKRLLAESDPNLQKYNKRKYFIKILSRVAAILILPVFSFGLYMSFKYQMAKHDQISVNHAYNEVFSSADAITKVTLPDGSNVWLNHNSSLKYPAMFNSDTRNVELIGEGYFEIFHNVKMPFIVKAGEIQVKALGTEFNIMAYPDEDRIETSLINGRVDLQRSGPNRKEITLLKMKPTDLAVFQISNHKINTYTINDDRYFSWKEGKLVFYAEPLGEVVKKLSRWFNVDIQIKDSQLFEYTYTATFVHETLPEVLELISRMSPVNYSISDRKALSSGTFTKRKIILSYRRN